MGEYVVRNTDGLYTKRCKEEANIYLASLSSKYNNYYQIKKDFDDLILLSNTLDKISAVTTDNKVEIINKLHRLTKFGILSPLTLQNEEFINVGGSTRNKRFMHIYKVNDVIYNEWAYNICIKKLYDDEFELELKFTPTLKECNHIVYISKGGIITGEYIKDCIIRPELKGKFSLQSVPNIPVSAINYKKEDMIYDTIYVVDHREPKLKVLKEFYYVPIYTDEYIKGKFNIRKYKKLK